MGVDSQKAPPLPAPTETDTNTPTELTTTELSKPGDEKSSYSIPDDGTPVTIRTRGHKANKSQTSLLIEYFEGSRSSKADSNEDGSRSERRPSVRVRLTPSRKGKGDHLQVTESSRKASSTRRIPLDQGTSTRRIDLPDGSGDDVNSMSSYNSATEESNVSRNPIDIEIDHRPHRRRRPASPLIPSNESYLPVDASEISAIPADSFLDGSGPGTDLKPLDRSRGETLATAAGAGALAGAAAGQMSSSKKKDRVKIADKPKEKSDRKRRSKSRTSSVSDQPHREERSSRQRSSRGQPESAVSGVESSLLSSQLTPSHRSMGAHSERSDVSKTSINNPKLLETVEDAIRRLILPELSALKREQSKRETRRGSLTSTGTSVSREDLASPDRRRSSGQRSESKRRNREARHVYGDGSPHSISRDSLNDDYDYDYAVDNAEPTTPKRSGGGDLLKAAAAGAALSKGLSAFDEKPQSEDRSRRDRRRRRTETARSRGLGQDQYADEYEDDDQPAPAPPMPLMSDINASDMTRTSILSADSERPHSASEERGIPDHDRNAPASLTQVIGTSHANVSHGDLTALPRGQADYVEEYETDDFGRKVPMGQRDEYYDDQEGQYSDPGDYPDRSFEEEYYSTQDVPPPLKYVPYQAGARGLSPIPSVSGYTEGGSEAPQPRHSQSLSASGEAYPSPDKSLQRDGFGGSAQSLNSVPSNMRSWEFDHISADGGDYRNTMYTEDSELGGSSGQAVRGVGANPNIIHPPSGVESNVASLIDGSMLEQSALTSGSGLDYHGQRDSNLSYDQRTQSSRGVSPEKRSLNDERHPTPGSRSQDQSQEYSEYELDEHGRKVATRSRYRESPTASEAAITAGAVGAAAAALKAAQERRQAHVEDGSENWVPAGVGRNKSFKERTMEGYEPRNTPAHSIDRFSYDEPKMGASGLPDMDDPMPEVGYVDDDALTNPSIVQDRLDGAWDDGLTSGRATPTQRSVVEQAQQTPTKAGTPSDRGLGITEAAGAAALGAAAGMAAAHSREPSQDQDEWQRTSDDRKRDTLLTNPYEDASPIVNPALNDNLLGARGLDAAYGAGYHTGSPGFGQKYDEGYMSNGPNPRSPDVKPKGRPIDLSDPSRILGEGDPFTEPKGNAGTRQLSGMSQGMGSPFYDAATGAGIDRIENKDIVALMQHLMVRDAQRSARDTEIVALLMNAALEMRTSFREMKDLIQDTGDDVIFSNSENTEKLQKAINGPRPFPGTGSRSIQSSQPATTSIDDAAQKKKNLWKRALAGLSAKGTNDLSRIEDMLVQLLGEVDVLKTQTGPGDRGSGQSTDNLQPEGHYEEDRGYEPEGVPTASHASQSGHLSIPQSQGQRPAMDRAFSGNRVSTVEEHEDEYEYDHPTPSNERSQPMMSGAAQYEQSQRGGSVPPGSPSQHASSSYQQQALSADNTPRTEKGKKHKSSSSSGWIPKISRWSETTASSVGRAFRGSGNLKKEQKYEDQPPPSRSGSSLASYERDYELDPYGEDKLHSGFSDPNLGTTIENDQPRGQAANLMHTEDPKYRAHRNSLNLQHPQPRTGATERFRTALETSAQDYDDEPPMTPRSADWAGSATSLNRLPAHNTNRYSNTSSAAREGEYWSSPTAQSGPPRPPKEPIENSYTGRTPPRARISNLAKSSPLQNQVYDDGYRSGPASPTSGSPKLENRNLNAALGVPSRRPSGPRSMTPKSAEEEAAREERRRKRDTFGTVASQDTDTF